MICPKCQKKETSVVLEKYDFNFKSNKRQRECKCGYLFVTYEINARELEQKTKNILKFSYFKKGKKEINRTKWKNFRLFRYAGMRLMDCTGVYYDATNKIFDRLKLIKENCVSKKELYDVDKVYKHFVKNLNLNINQDNIKKIGGKSYFTTKPDKEIGKLIKKYRIKNTLKFPNKKSTVKKSIDIDFGYWEARYELTKKPIQDKNNKNLYRKELNEYYHSVCDLIDKPPFNKKEYFIDYSIDYLDDPVMKKYWSQYWKFFTIVR